MIVAVEADCFFCEDDVSHKRGLFWFDKVSQQLCFLCKNCAVEEEILKLLKGAITGED